MFHFRKININIIHSKPARLFAFLSIFFLFVPDLVSSVLIIKTFTLLPSWSSMLLNLACALLSCVSFSFLHFYMVKAFHGHEEKGLKLDLLTGLSVSSFWALTLGLFTVLTKYIYPVVYPIFAGLSFSMAHIAPGSALYLLVGLILVILSVLLFFSSLLAVLLNQSLLKAFPTWLKALSLSFRMPVLFILLLLGTVISGALTLLLAYASQIAMSKIAISAFLAHFVESALLSAWVGFALIMLTSLAVKRLAEKPEVFNSLLEKKGGYFSFVFLGLAIVLGVFLNIPSRGSFADYLLKSIDAEFSTAENLKAADKLDLSSYYYKRSYYLSQTAQAYLKLLSASKDKSFSDAEKNKLNQEFDAALKEALVVSPGIGLVYYIDALRNNTIKQPASAVSSLETAAIFAPEFPNSKLELLKLYKTTNEKTKLKGLTESIVNERQFYFYSPLEDKSLGELQNLAQKIAAKSSASYQNFSLLAYYYYENKLYPEATEELKALYKKLPDDFTVNYLTAMVDLEMMQDNKQYTDAIKAVEKISHMYPNEKWVLDLKTQVATKSGNKQIMETALEQAYLKNPSDIEVAEQYAYSIMSKNSSYTFNETDQRAEGILNKVIQQTNDSWFTFYCKSILDLKKKDFGNSLQDFGKFTSLIASQDALFADYDDFYYLYSLKYKDFLTYEEGKKALEGIKDTDTLAYSYIWGTYYWSVKDYDKSKTYIEQTIQLNPKLSKPHFILGSVYFEQGYLKKIQENYPLAVVEYNKALAIFTEDPYTWFSLGHVYKNLGHYEDALGAFQKALLYMPAEDHNFDHFGVSIHSKLQIDEIKSKLQSQPNK